MGSKYLGRLAAAMIADKRGAQSQLLSLTPRHPFLACFDMDGHLLDSMTAKQVIVFQPVFMDRFGLRPIESFYRVHAENHNLWTADRGSDRHEGKLLTVRSLLEDPHLKPRLAGPLAAIGDRLRALERALAGFVEWKDTNGRAYSYESLAEFAVLAPGDRIRRQLCEWTFCVDHEFSFVTIPMRPFDGVRATLEFLADKADVIIVSKTPYDDICNWLEAQDLIPFITAVAGREMGDKDEHICIARGGTFDAGRPKGQRIVHRGTRYADGRVVMGGDGEGDLTAARENRAFFFGTTPGRETAIWRGAVARVFQPFLKGACASVEPGLVAEFQSGQRPRGFWETPAYAALDGHINEYARLDPVRRELQALLNPGGKCMTLEQLTALGSIGSVGSDRSVR
jgi:phosphoglycolate phosphatase-like HAD superfamily hydrolase